MTETVVPWAVWAARRHGEDAPTHVVVQWSGLAGLDGTACGIPRAEVQLYSSGIFGPRVTCDACAAKVRERLASHELLVELWDGLFFA